MGASDDDGYARDGLTLTELMRRLEMEDRKEKARQRQEQARERRLQLKQDETDKRKARLAEVRMSQHIIAYHDLSSLSFLSSGSSARR